MTNQRQNQFRSPQYVTFGACFSVKSPFREHSLNTDLAGDNVPLATPAITGANPVCRASFSPSTLEATLTSFGFYASCMQGLGDVGLPAGGRLTHCERRDVFFFFFFRLCISFAGAPQLHFLALNPKPQPQPFHLGSYVSRGPEASGARWELMYGATRRFNTI